MKIKTKVWRVYAYRYNKRYIVEDFENEYDAIECCQNHNWQLIDKRGNAYDLAYNRVATTKKIAINVTAREAVATILVGLGLLMLIAAGGAPSVASILTVGGLGAATALTGVHILGGD